MLRADSYLILENYFRNNSVAGDKLVHNQISERKPSAPVVTTNGTLLSLLAEIDCVRMPPTFVYTFANSFEAARHEAVMPRVERNPAAVIYCALP